MEYILSQEKLYEVQFDVVLYDQVEEAELDEMWSFVQKKSNQRWLWLAINHATGDILAYTFGKRNTQTIERKNLTLRTRIKRLTRKSICFSKSQEMHDIVIGLVINILEFGWCVDLWKQQL